MRKHSAMDFSVIIPTVGRNTLERAVRSVLDQETETAFQIIVVNDSGSILPSAGWQTDPHVRMTETPRVERSRARNAGAELATGTLFLFLDDDDWLLPEALEQLWRAGAKAQWLLGDCRMVAPNGDPLATVHVPCEGNCAVQALAGEWLPLQSMGIHRELFQSIGGFRPLSLGEDRELAGRLALRADLKRVGATIAVVERNPRTSTSVYTPAQTRRYWEMRDALLDSPQAFTRLVHSAHEPYWRGRLVRLYLNATLLHARQGQLLTALRRAGSAWRAAWTADALQHANLFWRGVLQPHAGNPVR